MYIVSPDFYHAEQILRDKQTRGWTTLHSKGLSYEALGKAVWQHAVETYGPTTAFPVLPISVFNIHLRFEDALRGEPYLVWVIYFGLIEGERVFRFFDRYAEAEAHLALRDMSDIPKGPIRSIRIPRPSLVGAIS